MRRPEAGKNLDRVFSALSDPTRRAILARLAQGSATVTELWEPFDLTKPAISKHLKVLEEAGLMQREVEGRVHHCWLAPSPLTDAQGWIERQRFFWHRQLDALEGYLAAEDE